MEAKGKLETLCIHGGEMRPPAERAVAMPIYQSSTFVTAGSEGSYHDIRYIRLNNTPNHTVLHDKLALLEGVESAVVTASGMAAIWAALLAVLCALLFAPLAHAQSPSPDASPAATGAVIEGKIAVDEPPHAGDAPARDDETPFSNVLVYLDGFPAGTTFPPPAAEGSMKQKKKRFLPYILPIQVGATVRFPNDDDIFHNVFSLSQVQPFNIGRYPKGSGKTVTFSKVGRIRVFCDIHSFMKANILVLPSPHFVFPKSDGTFRLENVPAGTYWVTAWHERLKAQQKPVTIAAGQTVKLDFAIK